MQITLEKDELQLQRKMNSDWCIVYPSQEVFLPSSSGICCCSCPTNCVRHDLSRVNMPKLSVWKNTPFLICNQTTIMLTILLMRITICNYFICLSFFPSYQNKNSVKSKISLHCANCSSISLIQYLVHTGHNKYLFTRLIKGWKDFLFILI